ncbi:MAG: DUF2271 domain-containing protein [Kiritimatiellae bacterium]|nr:DUF2271 domain-containing protein [Kiritimatiellia bacterium]
MREHAAAFAAVTLLLWGVRVALAAPTGGTLELGVTIRGDSTGFGPRHVVAVWIEDAQGRWVRTLAVEGRKQWRRLEAWRAAAGRLAGPDAVTGATRTDWGRLTASWDGLMAGGTPAPDGEYRVRIETTWWNGAGPRVDNLKFTKGPSPQQVTLPDTGPFREIRLDWKPAAPPSQ